MRYQLATLLLLALTPLAYADIYSLTFSNGFAGPTPLPNSTLTINTADLLPQSAPETQACAASAAVSCFIAIGPATIDPYSGDPTNIYYQFDQYGDLDIYEALTPFGANSPYNDYVTFFKDAAFDRFTSTDPFFTGSLAAPVLPTGTLPYSSRTFFFDPAEGQVTITDLSTTSPVPEPSTLALFSTGLLGVAGALRRRLSEPGQQSKSSLQICPAACSRRPAALSMSSRGDCPCVILCSFL